MRVRECICACDDGWHHQHYHTVGEQLYNYYRDVNVDYRMILVCTTFAVTGRLESTPIATQLHPYNQMYSTKKCALVVGANL